MSIDSTSTPSCLVAASHSLPARGRRSALFPPIPLARTRLGCVRTRLIALLRRSGAVGFVSNHRHGPHQMLTACGCRLSGRIKLTHYLLTSLLGLSRLCV